MTSRGIMKVLERMQHPPDESKGYTRWWWFAAAVEEAEITKELRLMHEAGLGGVEIQVTYPMEGDSPEQGIEHQAFYSPRFFELLEHTLKEAEKLGMWVEFTLGSGWPFGGPFVPYEMAPEVLIPYQFDIIGPTSYQCDFTSVIAGKPVRAVIGKFEQGRLLEHTLKDVTDHIREFHLYGWPWGYRLEALEIPEGHWKLFVFAVHLYKQQVGKPAPGMEGYAIDHCRAEVSEFYFRNFGDPLVDKVGEGRIRTFFCDSLELAGNNWTPVLLEEFQKRRGYDLSPYMPALWTDIGEATAGVRYDYYKTFSELTIENFFRKFADWCHRRGAKARIQAHGTWGDILQAYAAADIPEGETFGEQDKYEVNTIHRRLASSAAHLYGRPVVTNETFTWLRKPRFMETLEMMKASVDAVFLDGMNQIVNHGYAYSPPSKGKPGWAFYASSFISHNNTWWDYYPELSRYIHAVSDFLQQGESFAQVGIVLPQADIWSAMPMAELHMALKLEEHMGRAFVNAVQKSGYYFDYFNDEALCDLGEPVSGGLRVRNNLYRVLILPRMTRMEVRTALRLLDFVQAGGVLLSLGHPPSEGCGLLEADCKRERIRGIMDRIFGDKPDQWHACGDGRALFVCGEARLLERLREILSPDVEIADEGEAGGTGGGTRARETVGFVHRVQGEDHLYFISHISPETRDVRLTFRRAGRHVLILDPMTRRPVYDAEVRMNGDGSCTCSLRLGPYQSLCFVFGPEGTADTQPGRYRRLSEPAVLAETELNGRWTLAIPELGFERVMNGAPVTWERFREARYYSGAGYYETKFDVHMPEGANRVMLVFEGVHEVADVEVNGVPAGVLWKAPRELDITPYVREGANTLKVKAVNLWINHMIDPSRSDEPAQEGISSRWPYFRAAENPIGRSPEYGGKEKQLVREPLPSGLSGTVRIRFLEAAQG